eukprot:2509444-Alexandrium_andersonii.AAC.1
METKVEDAVEKDVQDRENHALHRCGGCLDASPALPQISAVRANDAHEKPLETASSTGEASLWGGGGNLCRGRLARSCPW